MASEAAGTVAAVAAEAAADAAERVGAAVAAETVDTAAALAHAEARADRAEETAQAVTDAALHTALGVQVADVREDLDEWESEVEHELQALEIRLSSLSSQVARLEERLSQQTPAVVIPLPSTEASSTLPTSETPAATVPEVIPAVIVNPAGDHVQTPAVPVVPERPKRRLWI